MVKKQKIAPYRPKERPEKFYYQQVGVSSQSALKNKQYPKKIEQGRQMTQSIENDLKDLILSSQNGDDDSYLAEYGPAKLVDEKKVHDPSKKDFYDYGL